MVRRVVVATLRLPMVLGLVIGLIALGAPQVDALTVHPLPVDARVSVGLQTEPVGPSTGLSSPVQRQLLRDVVAGESQVLKGAIERSPEASTLAVAEDVEEALDDLAPDSGGVGVNSDRYRPATYLQRVCDTFSWLLAFCLMLVALALALVRARSLGLAALATVPMLLPAASLVLQWRGVGFNGALAPGRIRAPTRALVLSRRPSLAAPTARRAPDGDREDVADGQAEPRRDDGRASGEGRRRGGR